MNIGTLTTIMCSNAIIQNNIKNQNNKEEKNKSKKVESTYKSSFNKEQREGR